MTNTTGRRIINEWHCELCGNTNPNDVGSDDDGYYPEQSACCNDSIVDGADCPLTCSHD